jgi:hypothetical protein
MKRVAFYHKETGRFLPHVFFSSSGTDSSIADNTPPEHTAYVIAPGESFDALTQRFDLAAGHLVPCEPPPVASAAPTNAMDEILNLESKQHRAMREAMLGSKAAIDLLHDIDAQITALRDKL